MNIFHIPSTADPSVRYRIEEQSGQWLITRCVKREGVWHLQLAYRTVKKTRDEAITAAREAAARKSRVAA